MPRPIPPPAEASTTATSEEIALMQADLFTANASDIAGEMTFEVEYRKWFMHFDQKFGFKLVPDKYGNERWMKFSVE